MSDNYFISCSKCNTPIKKDGGCDHITCPNPNCKHQFCYLCGSDWNGHSVNSEDCKRKQESIKNQAQESEERPTAAENNDQDFDVIVKTIDGKTVTVKTKSSESINRLKEKVNAMINLNPDSLRIIHKGKQLESGNNVSNYQIKKGDVLYTMAIVRGGK